jgi:hypothetical protein
LRVGGGERAVRHGAELLDRPVLGRIAGGERIKASILARKLARQRVMIGVGTPARKADGELE